MAKSPDGLRAPGKAFVNPDYFNQTQQQQRAAATAPTQYFNVQHR